MQSINTKENTDSKENKVETQSKEDRELRDYFAAKAMQAWVSQIPPEMMEDMMSRWAENSYEMADAMLRAREK